MVEDGVRDQVPGIFADGSESGEAPVDEGNLTAWLADEVLGRVVIVEQVHLAGFSELYWRRKFLLSQGTCGSGRPERKGAWARPSASATVPPGSVPRRCSSSSTVGSTPTACPTPNRTGKSNSPVARTATLNP